MGYRQVFCRKNFYNRAIWRLTSSFTKGKRTKNYGGCQAYQPMPAIYWAPTESILYHRLEKQPLQTAIPAIWLRDGSRNPFCTGGRHCDAALLPLCKKIGANSPTPRGSPRRFCLSGQNFRFTPTRKFRPAWGK